MNALGVMVLVMMAADARWEPVGDFDGVKVWRQPTADSDVHRLRASAEIDAPPEVVWRVIDDAVTYPEFLPYMTKLQVLASDPATAVEYAVIDAPMTAPRDYTARIRRHRDPKRRRYRRDWTVDNAAGPAPCDGCVRVALNTGSWIIEPLGPSRTRLRYKLHFDPAGYLPPWLVNLAQSRGIPDVYAAITKRALAATESN